MQEALAQISDFLRKLKAAGKDVTPKVGGSGGGNNRGTKRKGGGGNECNFYKRTGTCKFGKDCKYDHVDGGKSGSAMMSKSQLKKMKNKVKTAVMQALEADAKSAGASGDDAKEEGKKKLAQMITSAAEDQQWDAFMLTDVVQDRSEVEQKRALEERGKVLFDAPMGAEDDCECIADCVI